MKLTVIPDEKAAIVDGVQYFDLDTSGIPAGLRLMVWEGESGWEYYYATPEDSAPCEKIFDIKKYNQVLASWTRADEQAKNPPKPANKEISTRTLKIAVQQLRAYSFLISDSFAAFITPGTKLVIEAYVGKIVAIAVEAQIAIAHDKAYEPAFPEEPSLINEVQFTLP